jgi:Zn-dependent protease
VPTIEALLERLTLLPLFILSLTVHEWAHAFSAWKLGDDTAASQGRLTLNPLVHIDLLGTIALPLLGVPFGWAKPVPVNPARFRRDVSMAGGMALTASAGPLSNLVLAVLSAVAVGILYRVAPAFATSGTPVLPLLGQMIFLNVALAVFNLLPVPPLDGSRLVAWLLPRGMQDGWQQVEQFAPFLLLAVFTFGGRIASGPIHAVYRYLLDLISLIA